MMSTAHEVFICHAPQDKLAADATRAALERDGLRCWMAPRDVPVGAPFVSSIRAAIDQSRAMVVVFSKQANASPLVVAQLEAAARKGVPMIAIRIDDTVPTKALGQLLERVRWFDATEHRLEDSLPAVVTAMRAVLAGQSAAARERFDQ
jgi:hypothetical protein